MSHFRVENARFRILKGGKIGLSLSIALASSLKSSGTTIYSIGFEVTNNAATTLRNLATSSQYV